MKTTTAGHRWMPLAGTGLLLSASLLLTACGTRPATESGPGAAAHAVTPTAARAVALDPAPSDAVPSNSPGSSVPCPASGVDLRAGEADAAMGLRVLTVELVNCGNRPYALNGYPAVRVLDENREPLDIAVGHGTSDIAVIDRFDAGPAPLSLQPGESARFGLVWRNTVTDGNDAPVNGSYLSVTPRPGDPAQSVPAFLDLGTTGKLGISAWSPSSR
ncbi:hypothetical protein GCM10010430_20050 [Kitasatospora cystarginea]|uniref:DUF4232 domain-containing protein n=1 Tax=Kitasatospora cystarginea TaxID=58350 RepID=A0ABN3DQ86_9ACTN